MSAWDALRAKAKGNHGAPAPTCSRCHRRRVMDPCRDCATPAELAATREATSSGRTIVVPVYPPLPERYR